MDRRLPVDIYRLKRRTKLAVRRLQDRLYLALPLPDAAVPKVPDFAVIGAMKAGTTSLHNYLNIHPDIYMSRVKEPGLFLDESPYMRANPMVHSHWAMRQLTFRGYRGERLVGESSTYYSEAPTLGAEAPENMFAQAPDIRLIYMLRNPFDRIVSHYWHCIDFGIYQGSIDSVIATDDTFLQRSSYFYQISRYLRFFPMERIHIAFFEDFVREPERVLAGIFAFLGVPSIRVERPNKRHNQSFSRKRSRSNRLNRSRLHGSTSLGNAAPAAMNGATYRRLIEPLHRDVEQLETLLGRKLNRWDMSERRWCEGV